MATRSDRFCFVLALALLALLATACNMPRKGATTPTLTQFDLINTAAARTREAQLTQISRPPAQSGETPAPPRAATATPPATQPAGAGPTATRGTAAANCDAAKFVEDVTVPDGTNVDPGESFEKTWRLQNTGTCTWTTAYAVAYSGRDRLGAPDSFPLVASGSVEPGKTVDVTVTLKAPDQPGTYRAEFKLRNAAGVVFGLSDGTQPFWAQVDVGGDAGVGYDFVARASSATWSQTVSDSSPEPLEFGREGDGIRGFALIRQDARLETGAQSGKLLLTHPPQNADGVITGVFPAYTVVAGDHLKARLGFITPDADRCGDGAVSFGIGYKDGDAVRMLGEWEETCDGRLKPIDLDLASLRGKAVQFVFIVEAAGSPEGDWAIWNSPRIER